MVNAREVLKGLTGRGNSVIIPFTGYIDKGLVVFGEIRMPLVFSKFSEEKSKQLERFYDCKIVFEPNYTAVVPNPARRKRSEQGFIDNTDKELAKELKDWLKTNFRDMVIDFQKLSGAEVEQ